MTHEYFSYCPESGFETHETDLEAMAVAQSLIDELRDLAADGWSDDIEFVCWGKIKQQAAMTGKREALVDDFTECEYICDYVLSDVVKESE